MYSDVFIMYELSSGTGHSGSTTFETMSTYCLKSNLIWSIEFGPAAARRLKRALVVNASIRWTKTEKEAISLCFGQESTLERSETELFKN